MPLDPSISLQVKPIQIQAPDPVQTLVTIAQLKNFQSQQDLRDLQIYDARRKMATLQALRQPGSPLLELYGQGGGGPPSGPMVPASQLGGMGQQMPAQQMPAPPMPGGGMAEAPLSTTPPAFPGQANYADPRQNWGPSQPLGAPNRPSANTEYALAPEEYQSPMMQQRLRLQGMSPEEQQRFQAIQERGQAGMGQNYMATVDPQQEAERQRMQQWLTAGGQKTPPPNTPGLDPTLQLPRDRAQIEQQVNARGPAPGTLMMPGIRQLTPEDLEQQRLMQQFMPSQGQIGPGGAQPGIVAQGNMPAFPGMTPSPQQRMPMQPPGGAAPPQGLVPVPQGLIGQSTPAPIQPPGGPQAPTPALTSSMPQPAGQVAPGGPQAPQGGQAPMPSEQSMLQDASRRNQLYTRLLSNYDADISAPIVDTLMKLDSHTMAQKKGALDQQATVAGMTYQLMSSVLAQDAADQPAAYAQARQMALQIGFPGARQLPEQYTPQTAQLVQYLATNARNAETRLKDQREMMDRVTNQYRADTDRIKEGREAREVVGYDTTEGRRFAPKYAGAPGAIPLVPGGLSPEAARAEVERQKLSEMGYEKGAGGEIIPTPKYPGLQPGGAGAGPQAGRPLMNPQTGQPYKSLEAQKFEVEREQTAKAHFDQQMEKYKDWRQAYGSFRASSDTQSPVGDMTILTLYMKMTDPDTGVRESEAKRAAQTGGLRARVEYWQNYIGKEGTLPLKVRADFINRVEGMYDQVKQDYTSDTQQVREQYKRQGLNPDNIITDFATTTRAKAPVTMQQVQALVQEDARRVEAEVQAGKPRRKVKTPDEVRQDLLNGGFKVVP